MPFSWLCVSFDILSTISTTLSTEFSTSLDPDKNLIKKATKYIRAADMLIIGGTSLVVNPAVGLAHEFREGKLVLINLGLTPFDDRADIVIHDKIGTVMSQL